jgi:uncharacterized repeat protein (TIGR01451 family)
MSKKSILLLILLVSCLCGSAEANNSAIVGVDQNGQLVIFNPWTGTEIKRMDLPQGSFNPGDTDIGLAGSQKKELYYINSNANQGKVYVLNPFDASIIRQFDIDATFNYVNGLGYQDDTPPGYLYTSGCKDHSKDMHRYKAEYGAAPVTNWSNVKVHDAVGGDDYGHVFAPETDKNQIVEVNPLESQVVNRIPCTFEDDILGMAYDGTYLYASTIGNMVYVINANTGEVIKDTQLGYTLYALAAIRGVLLGKSDNISDGSYVGPSDYITYTIEYLNLNGTYNNVVIVDELPEEVDFIEASTGYTYDEYLHTVTWELGTLEPDASGSVTVKVKVKCMTSGITIENYCEIKSNAEVLGTAYEYTPTYLKVDDFESYENTNELKIVWNDGTVNGTGSDVSASTNTLFRQIHEGDQAMAYSYDDVDTPYYSEAYAYTSGTYSLGIGEDWATKDVTALSLWFLGRDFRGSFSGSDPYVVNAGGLLLCNEEIFYFVHRYVSGQKTGEVVARVSSLNIASAMAGVMIRQSTAENSKYAMVSVTANNKVIFQQRRNNGITYTTTVTGITLPHWLKLGWNSTPLPAGTWVVQYAPDNNGSPGKWTTIDADPPFTAYNLTFGNNIYLGLCVSSNSYNQMCTAYISNVAMASPVSPYTPISDPSVGQDIGKALNDTEKMYIVLEDSDSDAIWYYPGITNPAEADTYVTQKKTWTEWRIDLKNFSEQGIDLTDVQKSYIGFGNRDNPVQDGSGLMFIDDIRLIPGCFPRGINYADQYVHYLEYKAHSNPLVRSRVDSWCCNDPTNCINSPCVYQCDGDVDGAQETLFKYRVYGNDLAILLANWKKVITDPDINPCADFDHQPETAFKYRVYGKDLDILLANWKKKDSQLPGNCPRPDVP